MGHGSDEVAVIVCTAQQASFYIQGPGLSSIRQDQITCADIAPSEWIVAIVDAATGIVVHRHVQPDFVDRGGAPVVAAQTCRKTPRVRPRARPRGCSCLGEGQHREDVLLIGGSLLHRRWAAVTAAGGNIVCLAFRGRLGGLFTTPRRIIGRRLETSEPAGSTSLAGRIFRRSSRRDLACGPSSSKKSERGRAQDPKTVEGQERGMQRRCDQRRCRERRASRVMTHRRGHFARPPAVFGYTCQPKEAIYRPPSVRCPS